MWVSNNIMITILCLIIVYIDIVKHFIIIEIITILMALSIIL